MKKARALCIHPLPTPLLCTVSKMSSGASHPWLPSSSLSFSSNAFIVTASISTFPERPRAVNADKQASQKQYLHPVADGPSPDYSSSHRAHGVTTVSFAPNRFPRSTFTAQLAFLLTRVIGVPRTQVP